MGKWFEWLLWQSRLVIVVAVVAGIFSAFLLIAIGTYDVYEVAAQGINFLIGSSATSVDKFDKFAITHVISAVDAYLIATVLMIFSIGLYELFISKIESLEKDRESSRILVVHNLEQLKEKLAKVIVMVLIVTYFKFAVGYSYASPLDLLYLVVGILLIAVSSYMMHKAGHDEDGE